MIRRFSIKITELFKKLYLRLKKAIKFLILIYKRLITPYFLGLLVFILIVLVIFVIRNFTLSSAEIGLVSTVIGGFVSGGLTLIGVKATLENQKDEKFIDLYPERKMVLDEQLDKMAEINKFYKNDVSDVYYGCYKERYNKLRDNFYEYVRKSIIINAEVYIVTKAFLFHLEEIDRCMGPIIEELTNLPKTPISPAMTCINGGKEDEYKEHFKQLEKYYKEIKSKMNSFDDKYKKLTGT